MDESLDTTFKALADPTRRAMLTRLSEGEQTIAALAEPFAMSLWGAAKHVRVLEAAGLVSCRKAGRSQFCSLRPGPLAQADRWLRQWERFWTARLDHLDALIEREKKDRR